MKKLSFFSVLLLTGALAFAQESFTYESTHYAVRSFVSADNAQAVADQLEAYLAEYNNYFHFDIDSLGLKLKVRIFAEKAKFDSYVNKLINETRDDYVYLHYSDQARSELVGFVDADKPVAEASISHQAFIQFLRAFVPNPPLWLREGFAVYFEELKYDAEAKTASLHENLGWLETLKDLTKGTRTAEAMSFDDLLTIGVDAAREKIAVFYPQAWSLVNFLANSDVKANNRILWDAIRLLSPSASLDDNSKTVQTKAFAWQDAAKLQESYLAYFDTKKTYKDLIQDGIDDYAAGKAKESETAFTQALTVRDDSYVPYYYLGLINYDKASYGDAETLYSTALEKGASPALTNYALGVNAFADNRYDVATTYLNKTVELDATFTDKVNELLARMEN